MDARAALKKLADRKEQEIHSLRLQLAQAEAYLQAIQDSIRVLPREQETSTVTTALREGTAIAQARDILAAAGRSLHILEILKQMGRTANKQNRVSLGGSLAAYVRRNQVFRKTAPNTFALLDNPTASKAANSWDRSGIPEDFGKMGTEDDVESSFSPFAHNSPARPKTQLLSAGSDTPPDATAKPDMESAREEVSQALDSAGHASAAQLLRTGTWSTDGHRIQIEIAGVGKKTLALVVNAAAERVIRDSLLKMGLPTRLMINSSAIPRGE